MKGYVVENGCMGYQDGKYVLFADESDYDKIDQMDELELADIRDCIKNNKPVVLKNITKDEEYNLDSSHLSDRQRAMLLCGGLLDYTREQNK